MMLFALALASAGSHGLVYDRLADRLAAHGTIGKVVAGLADRMVDVRVGPSTDEPDDSDDGDSGDADETVHLEVIPPIPPLPPEAPRAPLAPGAPRPPGLPGAMMSGDEQHMMDAQRRVFEVTRRSADAARRGADAQRKVHDFRFEFHTDERTLPLFSETGKDIPTADLLQRIASTAGWSMTIVGSPGEKVSIDVKNVDPRQALRTVLQQSGAMGVLKRERLVVVASPDKGSGGLFIEQRSKHDSSLHGPHSEIGPKNDLVRIFQGDVTVPQGTVVQGDVVCVGGSIELEPGSVVQGDVNAVLGSVTVDQGALVLGQAVSVLGVVDVARGGQVMGEHVQIGLGKIFRTRSRRGSFFSHLGPFGFFPTLALFALVYLLGLLALRMWPERVQLVGHAMFESPLRSFVIGFLCWLLLVPTVVLLAISIVGIPLLPLLPIAIFLSIVLGLSSLALRLGEALPAGPGQRFVPPAALGMGMTVMLLLAFVPWLGVSMLALLQFFALGAAVGSRYGRALPPHV